MSLHPINLRSILTADPGGQNAATGVEITIRNVSTNSTSALYGDAAGAVPIGNPFITNGFGQHPDARVIYVTPGDSYAGFIGGVEVFRINAPIGSDYIVLSQFNVFAGLGGDDTAAFDAALAASIVQKKPVLFIHMYNVAPSATTRQAHSMLGHGKLTGFKCNTQTGPASNNLFNFQLPNGGFVRSMSYDGNLTADPLVWNSTTYNSWGGGNGFRLIGSNDISIDQFHVSNVVGPAQGLYNCNRVYSRNCTSTRVRGNFGDCFFVAEGEHFAYENCYGYDFTRIGFVTDKTSGVITNHVNYTNCLAEYGHDQSINYGGIEYNAGFWCEFGINVTYTRCRSYDTTDSGFRAPIALDNADRGSAAVDAQEQFNITYIDCVVGKSGYGWTNGNLSNNDTNFTYINCEGYDLNVGVYVGNHLFSTNPAKLNKTRIINCKLYLNNTTASRGVDCNGGDIVIDGLDVYYPSVPDWQTLAEAGGSNGTISWFGGSTQRPYNLKVKNLKAYLGTTRQRVDARVSVGFSTVTDSVVIEDSEMLFVDTVSAKNIRYSNCKFTRLGQNSATESLVIEGCEVGTLYGPIGSANLETAPFYSTTKSIRITDNYFNIPTGTNQFIRIDNLTSTDAFPKVNFSRNVVKKDMTTGPMIRFNADTPLFNTQNVMRLIAANNLFINTGAGAATYPIVQSPQRETGGNTVNVQVMGKGNFKSNNIGTLATSGVIVTNFECLPYDAA